MSVLAPIDAAAGVAHTLLYATATALAPVGGAVTAVVVLTVAVRLLLAPLRYAQFRAQRTQQALAPRVARLRERYGSDPNRLGSELTALYRAERTTPLAGCLPALAQAPFITVLYRLFTDRGLAHGRSALPGHVMFGTSLDATLTGGPGGAGRYAVFAVLLGVLALLAWWSGRQAALLAPGAGPLVRLLPFGTAVFAAVVPLAAGVYLVTSTAYSVAETAVLRRVLPRGDGPTTRRCVTEPSDGMGRERPV